MKFSLLLLSLTLFFSLVSCTTSFPSGDREGNTLEEVVAAAEKQGINGLIHGADHERRMYVLSWSHPKNFFNRYNLVMAPNSLELAEQFKTLNRGDRIFIQGDVRMNRGQGHVLVNQMNIKKRYVPKADHSAGEFSRMTELPGDLKNKSREVFYIHATEAGNTLLVLEHGDTMVPMIVRKPELVKDLFRGDYVELAFKIDRSSSNPYRPNHLTLDHEADRPVKVIDSVVDLHDKEISLEGRLVMFPKSPTINRNIFAIEVPYVGKPARYFTILPSSFEGDNFKNLLAKIQSHWDANPQLIFKGRNKYIHLELECKAKGKGNVVSPNQANPQIFTSIDDLHIIGGKKPVEKKKSEEKKEEKK
ncbi:MAG: hypothetical protein NE328_24060 [Lentisphaeraceae bacterium]|nr:hypothetical protein [Lentisphaeraceae bacterium]